ncbi:MAG: hypothetical protein PHT03_02680 [Bacilli bacterium]|nr:hypothetical protein [Bacilli bacterium]MDD4388660.1 hypothetical protein [Bacilli bacterium]
MKKDITGNYKLEITVMQGSIAAAYDVSSEYHIDSIDYTIRVYE